MLGAGKADVFFGLIVPHGAVELTAVFIAGGVGLRTGWRGSRPDPAAGQAWPRPAGWPGWWRWPGRGAGRVRGHRGVRDAVGPVDQCPDRHRIAAEVAFLAYVIGFGRRAAGPA